MPYTYNWEAQGLYRKFTGIVSSDEILLSNFETHKDPHFKNIKYVLNDFIEVVGHSIEAHHTQVYAKTDEIISNTKNQLIIALVVTQDPLTALAHSYREHMIGKRFECEVFQTIDDARKWVSI